MMEKNISCSICGEFVHVDFVALKRSDRSSIYLMIVVP